MSSENAAAVAKTDHEFATQSTTRLVIKYGGLTLIGMLAQAIMVILEGIIIGNGLGVDGLACVGLVMPLENLQIAIGTGFGIGLSTVAAIKMGSGDKEGARQAFATGTFFIALFMFVVGLCLIAFAPAIARLLGTPDEYMHYMVPFIRVFGVGYPFCGYGQTVVFFFRMDERPSLSTAAMTITAILGVVYLYINCFIANFGIVGTGWYYAFSIGGWSFFGIYFFFSNKTAFRYHRKDIRLDWKVNLEAIKIALPYFCVQASTSVFTIIINNIIGKVGTDLHIAAYAIISGYVVYILNMFTTSISTGTTPIISYNLGEKMFQRLRSLMTSSVLANLISVGVVCVAFELLARQICVLFCGGDAALVEVTVPAVRIAIACAWLGSCISIMSSYFEAVTKLIAAVFTGIGRYLILSSLVMLVMVFVFNMGITGVWAALPVADGLAFIVTVLLMARESKRLKGLVEAK